MSRNAESHFSLLPNVDISRSTFKRDSSLKTSFNTGDLVPIYLDEVLPGDTFDLKTSFVCRLQTPVTPFMDNMYLDLYYFFVPNRLVWNHWKELNGENTESAWLPETEYSVPQIEAPASTGWTNGTLADYFGLPTGITDISVSALPFRAYSLICNEWFRDENLLDPLNIPVDDTTQTGSNGSNYITDVVNGGMPFKAAKYHDYFTSCLPAPQKGPEVGLPIGAISGTGSVSGIAPVYGDGNVLRFTVQPDTAQYGQTLTFGGVDTISSKYNINGYWSFASQWKDQDYPAGTMSSIGIAASNMQNQIPGYATKKNLTKSDDSGVLSSGLQAEISNLPIDLDAGITVGTINQLRTAFQIQKLYERDARGGTRYVEVLKSHFGVTSPDARLQRPEYLGGRRVPLHVNQVVQNSSSDATSPMGNVAGQSLTTDSDHDFTKSFTEHGFVIGLVVVRYDHSYQQGIERMWSRKTRFDYYWPVFASIGEQAVLNKEVYAQGSSVVDEYGKAIDDKAFGYQEAWADYRYKPSKITGEMRSTYAQSLDSWHLGDDYASLPSLSADWIFEDMTNVDRVLSVTSATQNQLFADFYFQNKCTRPMPMYSIPGLLDHH